MRHFFLFTNESAVPTTGALRDSEFTKPIYTKLGTEISHSFVEILKNGLACSEYQGHFWYEKIRHLDKLFLTEIDFGKR